MAESPGFAPRKRKAEESSPDSDPAAKCAKKCSSPELPSDCTPSYEEILTKLPPIANRVQRYCGVDRSRTFSLPTTKFPWYSRFKSTYLPLLSGEIRLFKVCAGSTHDPIQGVLVHVPLSAVEDRYEALSYVWGSSAASEAVAIRHWNGSTETSETKISIKPSLHAALRQLRRQDQEVVLWADALCIDQQNTTERSEQVRRMSDIYRCAANVIVWLGESSMESRVAMRTISSMLIPGFFSKITSYDWTAVYDVLQNEWFSRRWVVQEIVSAKNATLMIGEDKLDWRDFTDAVELFETNIDDISQQLRRTLQHKYETDPLGSLSHSGALELMRTIKQLKASGTGQSERPRRNLEWLLTSLKAFQTADPRDSIYALLAIAADGASITPDYRKSLLEVLTDVMVHVIKQSSSLDILLRYWFPISQDNPLTMIQPLSSHAFPASNFWDNHEGGIADNSAFSNILHDVKLWGNLFADSMPKNTETVPLPLNTDISQGLYIDPMDSSIRPKYSIKLLSRVVLNDKLVNDQPEWTDFSFSAPGSIPKWIRSADRLPFGDPRARSTRRINGNPLVGLPGESHYSATKGKPAEVRFEKGHDLSPAGDYNLKLCNKLNVGGIHSGVLYAKGVELGIITDLSARMADGLALQECLEMGGFPLRHATAGQDVPDRLWRTLVAGRDSKGQVATTLYRLAFVNLANQISEHRSIDPGELLLTKLDSYIRNFVARMEEVVWNRRIFKGRIWNFESSTSRNDGLFGLAPQQARINDKICLLYGCSVPVVLREIAFSASTVDIFSYLGYDKKYYEIVGEAYVDGFMDGEAFQGEFGEELEGQAKEFALA